VVQYHSITTTAFLNAMVVGISKDTKIAIGAISFANKFSLITGWT